MKKNRTQEQTRDDPSFLQVEVVWQGLLHA
jgi:hypothetical protein